MRADRLVSLVLLLRQGGTMTATVLARELEVSPRTVLRDIEALSAAGVPVYAERGRHGGFSLLPGFRTELTGLNPDEALALLTSGSGGAEQAFGLGSALASALRKIVDALPESSRASTTGAARRFLVNPEAGLLPRRAISEEPPAQALAEIRRAVSSGHKLRLQYAPPGRPARWRTIDPLGLVTARGRGYLLATADGSDRTYRLSRVSQAQRLPEPAERPADLDLDELWRQRCERFLAEGHLTASVRVLPGRRDELLDSAVGLRSETVEPDGQLLLEVMFQDLRHAVWAVWQLGPDAEALSPADLRVALGERARQVAHQYRVEPSDTGWTTGCQCDVLNIPE